MFAKFTATSPKIEYFSTIGFLVAQEISRFLYTIKNLKKENGIYDKPNNFGIQLNEKVYIDDDASCIYDQLGFCRTNMHHVIPVSLIANPYALLSTLIIKFNPPTINDCHGRMILFQKYFIFLRANNFVKLRSHPLKYL